MVRYLKDCCGFFHLRYAAMLIASIQIVFSIYFVNDGVTHVHEIDLERTNALRNITHHDGNASHPQHPKTLEHSDSDRAAVIAISVVGSLNIIVSIALFVCGLFNNPKLRILLFLWIAWTFVVVILNIIVIVFYLIVAHSFLDGLRVFVIYGVGIMVQIFCIWVVASYHRYLAVMAHGPAQGYRIVFNSRGAEPHAVYQTSHQSGGSSDEPPSYSTVTRSTTSMEMLSADDPAPRKVAL